MGTLINGTIIKTSVIGNRMGRIAMQIIAKPKPVAVWTVAAKKATALAIAMLTDITTPP